MVIWEVAAWYLGTGGKDRKHPSVSDAVRLSLMLLRQWQLLPANITGSSFKEKVYFICVCVYLCVWTHAHVSGCPRRTEESARSLGAGVTVRYQTPDKLKFSRWAKSAPNCWAMSSVPKIMDILTSEHGKVNESGIDISFWSLHLATMTMGSITPKLFTSVTK